MLVPKIKMEDKQMSGMVNHTQFTCVLFKNVRILIFTVIVFSTTREEEKKCVHWFTSNPKSTS